ncbi:cobalamin biosynthesis protein [Nonomuraea sp. LP-02]|uniref:cobalamin biosynthesis protein n=1 Tax=Nonomuraea sp. LP-02 TaxID=3097960 RepID=UPI002E36EEB7|nr:cobalamin biosynthesis protein [Nonomuraea sp. LP-02]MED7930351.1 cobalamin biosynthesis protein [Nonomuraea sp. LP-02]
MGLAAGVMLDRVIGDPQSAGHPVAVFGRVAGQVERVLYRDSRAAGVLHVALCVGGAVALGVAMAKAGRGKGRGRVASVVRVGGVAGAAWAVLGGTTLAREGLHMAEALEDGDLERARKRLPHLCGRDPSGLGAEELARATVESLAENTSDAVVAPLFWGAVAGVPGLLGYRAVNTLDAMVGHKSARYLRFGWAAARLDDVANYVPARLTALLTVLAGPDRRGAWSVVRRDGHRHPSPNAGRCEAAFAGALGVTLGGTNVYGSRVEHRPTMGDGPRPGVADIRRAVRLTRVVSTGAAVGAIIGAVVGAAVLEVWGRQVGNCGAARSGAPERGERPAGR